MMYTRRVLVSREYSRAVAETSQSSNRKDDDGRRRI